MSTRAGGNRASLAQAKRQGAHVGEMQRRRLLLAIGELLSEGGVEAATVGSISRRAGVSRRTFYEVFEDREACFLAAFEQAIERIAQEVVPAYARERKWSGQVAARRELDRPLPKAPAAPADVLEDPFKGLSIRFTYRTARVLATIAAEGGRGSYPSNRLIADSSGIGDEGQMSRLLRRLQAAGLIENRGEGHTRGEPNAWWLTPRGHAIHTALAGTEKVPA